MKNADLFIDMDNLTARTLAHALTYVAAKLDGDANADKLLEQLRDLGPGEAGILKGIAMHLQSRNARATPH